MTYNQYFRIVSIVKILSKPSWG